MLSMLPIGLFQAWASVEYGTWYARSSEFMQTPMINTGFAVLGRVVEILVHLIFGTMRALARALRQSRVSRRVNVSFLERYNATDRHKNARKVRKTYTFSKDWRVHESMTYFSMYSYNFCWAVRTLAQRDEGGRVRSRSPAMAAGLADHVWTMREWITMPSVQLA